MQDNECSVNQKKSKPVLTGTFNVLTQVLTKSIR